MIEIKQLLPTKSELRQFVKFQINLYKGNKYFVPPLIFDEIDTLNPLKNPAFEHCESAYFIACDGDKTVGRIAAIINHQTNRKNGTQTMRFGFIDFIDNIEVSRALFDAAIKWGRSKKMTQIIGPLGFTDLDREGTLIDGFDQLSTMATTYNHPYYARHIEAYGFQKDTDWVEYLMTVPQAIPEKHNRIAEIIKKKYNLRTLKYTSRKAIKQQYGQALFELINEAYADLYGYSTLTQRQIDHYVEMYISLLNLDLVTLIVDADNKLIAVGISMQSMSRALQKANGKLWPLGWYHLLRGLKGKNDRVDLMLVAVKPEYQNKGVNALLFQDLIPQYIKYGFKYAESNPEMETNAKVQNQWDSFESRQHRRRRAYKLDIR